MDQNIQVFIGEFFITDMRYDSEDESKKKKKQGEKAEKASRACSETCFRVLASQGFNEESKYSRIKRRRTTWWWCHDKTTKPKYHT